MSSSLSRTAVAMQRRAGSSLLSLIRPVGIAMQQNVSHAHRHLFTGGRQALLRPSFSSPVSSRSMSSLPSHTFLSFPGLSPTMTQGNIAKWMIKEGQKIAPGDQLADIETDKATIAWESQEDGIVAKILVPEGASDVPVGKACIVIVDDAKDVAAFANFSAPADAAKPAAKSAAAAAAPVASTPPPPPPSAAPSAPPPSASASVTRGTSFVAAMKGKKWAFSKEYGLKTPQHQY